MSIQNDEQKRNTKAIEKLLFNYRDTDTRIESMEIEIEMVTYSYDTLRGRSDNEIKPSTPTNQISSTVESNLIAKEERIDVIEKVTFVFLEQWRSYKELLKVCLQKENSIEKKNLITKYLKTF